MRRALCVAIAASLAGPALAQRIGGGQPTAGMVVDGDADGVSDDVDDCPYSPPGVAVNARGCSGLPDQDGDGVPDAADVCPLSPRGARVAPDGCALDSDGDKVADGLDYCPNTPRNQDVDEQGCAVNESTLAAAPGPSLAPPATLAATTPMGTPLPPASETVTTVSTVTTPSAPVETTVSTITTAAPTDIVATVPAPPHYDRAPGPSVVTSTGSVTSSRQAAPGLRVVRPDPAELARLRDAQRASAAGAAATGPRVAADTSRLPRAPLGSDTETAGPRRAGRKASTPPLPTVLATTTTTSTEPTTDATPVPAAPATTTTVTTVATATPTAAPMVDATRAPVAPPPPLRIVRPTPAPAAPPLRIVRPAPVPHEAAAPAGAVSRPIVSSLKPGRRAGRGAGKAARRTARNAARNAAPGALVTVAPPAKTEASMPVPAPRVAVAPAASPVSDLLYVGHLPYTTFTVEYRATLPAAVPVVVPEDTRASLNGLADRLRPRLANDASLSYVVAGCRVVGRDTDEAPAQARAQAVGSILATRLGVAYKGRVGLDRPVSVDSAFLPARQACADVRAVHVAAAAGVGAPAPAPAPDGRFLETVPTPTSPPVSP